MALTDIFTGSNGTLLTAHATSTGNVWAVAEGASPDIQSNKASSRAGGFARHAVCPSDAAFPDNQYAMADIKTADVDGNLAAVAVRISGDTYFYAHLGGASFSDLIITKRVAASNQFLNSTPHGLADGSTATVRLTATGAGVGGLVAEILVGGSPTVTVSTTSAAIASGKPGLHFVFASTAVTADNFESTDPSGGGGGSATRHLTLLNG